MKERLIPRVALALLTLFLLIWTEEIYWEPPPVGETELIIAADPHFLAPELTDHGAYFQAMMERADGKATQFCEEVTDTFAAQVIAQSPDGLILAGDLTFNGARKSHEVLAKILQRVQDAGIPVFVLLGNHDLNNPMAASFHGDGYAWEESVTGRQFAEIYQAFGYQDALSRDAHSLSYTAQLTPELRLLLLDVNTPEASGCVTGETLAWVREQLAMAHREGVRVLAVSHQNLLQHNSLFSEGYVMGGCGELLPLFTRYDVICNLSGHLHIQHIAQSGDFPEIATGSLTVAPLQYGVLRLCGTTGTYETREIKVSPEISAYAKEFFWEASYQQALAALEGDTAAPAMAEYFADTNAAYFAGRMDLAPHNANLLDAWKRKGVFLSVYLQSIADDAGSNDTSFSFDF